MTQARLFQKVVFVRRFRVFKIGGEVVFEKVHDPVVQTEFSFRNREAGGRRAETLAQRVKRMGRFGRMRRPPAFPDRFSVTQNHHAVRRDDFRVQPVDQPGQNVRRDPLRLGRRAGKFPVFIEILRLNLRQDHEHGKKNSGKCE